jgi:cellulose synthase/poly-beta-1,6-N-acetylglucosamine synthase-like glycosyltransferase
MTLARTALELTEQSIIIYFLLLHSFVALLLILAVRELWRHWHIADDPDLAGVLTSQALPPLSILVATQGARVATPDEIQAYLALEYPRHEVIIVCDGIPERLAAEYDLYPVPPAVMVTVPTAAVRGYHRSRRYSKLLLIDKEHVGRADALNACVNAARYPYVLVLDTGTLLEQDALLRLARPFLLGKSVAIAGGALRVGEVDGADQRNGTAPAIATQWLRGVQSVESLRSVVFSRLGWNRLGGSMDLSGAVCLFLRDHVLAVGGYRASTAGEDSDLAVRVHRHLQEQGLPNEIRLVPEAVAWTAPLATSRALGRQRERWHRGLIGLLASNRDLLLNTRYGATGLVAFPYLLIGDALAPFIEVAGYVCLILALLPGGSSLAVLFLLVGPGYATLLSLWAIALERSGVRRYGGRRPLFRLVLWALAEPFGYRQMLLWARLRASWRFVRGGGRHSWSGTPRNVTVGRRNPLSEGI